LYHNSARITTTILSMLIMMNQHQKRHAADTNYRYHWTNADLQK